MEVSNEREHLPETGGSGESPEDDEDSSMDASLVWARGLGIDLGSSCLRVAAWLDSEVRPLPELSVPAYVAFTLAGKLLLGHEAKSTAQQQPGNAFTVGALLRRLHSQRQQDPEGREPPATVVVATIAGRPREFLVVEILALVLCRLRVAAQEHLSQTTAMDALVLSIPTYCGLVQRGPLEEAAGLAGFTRTRLIKAPVGAALWRYRQASLPDSPSSCAPPAIPEGNPPDERQVFLIDVGAGHLDCALVVMENGVFEVRWAGGYPIGGYDIDECLAQTCHMRAGRKCGEIPKKLISACEKAKRSLSSAKSARIHVDRLWGEEGLDVTITAQELKEALQSSIMPAIVECVRGLLDRTVKSNIAARDHRDIDEVILLGGSIKLSAVQTALQEQVFADLHIRSRVICQASLRDGSCSDNANGAALQGAILGAGRRNNDDPGALSSLMLIDSCSHSLGVQVEDGPAWAVPANSPIPTARDVQLRLQEPLRPGAVLHIREENIDGRGAPSCWLGAISLTALPASAEEDAPHLRLTLEVDASGRLHTEARSGPHVVASGLSSRRRGFLTGEALRAVAAELKTHCADRWSRYGLRTELPPLLDACVEEQPPFWHVELVDGDSRDEEEDVGGDYKLPSPKLLGDECATQSLKQPLGFADARAAACMQRLRRKVDERRQQSQKAVPSAAEHQPLSTTEVCAVCLCTEAELGRPFPWVLQKCGHRCVCKLCLRKMKARQKRGQVECPLCRVQSRPILRERYEGKVFTAEDEP